jgi:propanol-preferring alcohol dehydrogenase
MNVPTALLAVRRMGEVDRLTVAAGTLATAMIGERQLVSVASLPRQDGIDFLHFAPTMGIVTLTTRYPIKQANQALGGLRVGRCAGATDLVP